MSENEQSAAYGPPLKKTISRILGFIAFLWVVEIVNFFTGHELCKYGIIARDAKGLLGILLCPFIHASFVHLLANSLPLAVLGFLVIIRKKEEFFSVTLFTILAGGACVWLFGRSGPHVGASGLVFGYFGFLIARGWYIRDFTSIVIALFTLLFYGGLIWGAFPSVHGNVSWESHLFGMLAGAVAVRVFVKKNN